MQSDKASITAEMAAVIRAIESQRPEGERLCYDPYAQYLISGGSDASVLEFWRNLLLSNDRDFPGVLSETVLRTRYIDDYVRERICDNIRQMVILGAGFDSRAYRIDGLETVRVFEVDHPATQKLKRERLREIPEPVTENVVYVPIDFLKEKLDQKLSESGYDRRLKTLFIWEGVTPYLTAEAVDETLAFVVNNSPEGSSIIFNYLVEPAGDGPREPETSWWTVKRRQEWLRHFEEIGEPFTFGIQEGTVEEFLHKRGFHQVVNATCKDMKNAFATGSNSTLKLTPWLATVHATVKPWG